MRKILLCAAVLLALGGLGSIAISAYGAAPAPPPPTSIERQTLEMGDEGHDVRVLQGRLNSVGFWCGVVDGQFGRTTQRCVIDFQRVKNLVDDGVAGPNTWRVLARSKRVKVPKWCRSKPSCIAADLRRQVAYVKAPGFVRVIPISSGLKPTPLGVGYIQYKEPGNQRSFKYCDPGELCMLDPQYIGGQRYGDHVYAFHGSVSVPARPASNGCIRMPIALSKIVHQRVPLGTPTIIFGRFNERRTKAPLSAMGVTIPPLERGRDISF